MQTVTASIATPTARSASELFSRLLRAFRGAEVVQRPAIQWAEMKPIDFKGEDSSLTQEHLDVLR
jgi:hypothetical protein